VQRVSRAPCRRCVFRAPHRLRAPHRPEARVPGASRWWRAFRAPRHGGRGGTCPGEGRRGAAAHGAAKPLNLKSGCRHCTGPGIPKGTSCGVAGVMRSQASLPGPVFLASRRRRVFPAPHRRRVFYTRSRRCVFRARQVCCKQATRVLHPAPAAGVPRGAGGECAAPRAAPARASPRTGGACSAPSAGDACAASRAAQAESVPPPARRRRRVCRTAPRSAPARRARVPRPAPVPAPARCNAGNAMWPLARDHWLDALRDVSHIFLDRASKYSQASFFWTFSPEVLIALVNVILAK